jgi:hypothetical protein
MMQLTLTLRRACTILQSNRFFYLCLGLFILGAAWTAIVSLYPMAFDEEFHYGLIKIYATSWWPYGISHTSDMAQFGSATADPSYLFQYLMSFPYRLLQFFGIADQPIIIVLRFINITMVSAAITLFRKALLTARAGRLVTNLSLVLFMLIPVLTMLAAQINYDNLFILIIAECLLLTVTITERVLSGDKLHAGRTWLMGVLSLIGITVKYAFLPIVLALVIWLLVLVAIRNRRFHQSLKAQWKEFVHLTLSMSLKAKLALTGLSIIGLFFAAHYVTNIVSYGSPIPSCENVFDADSCSAYGPWNRNRELAKERSASFRPLSLPVYVAGEWIPGITQRLTFSVAGKSNDYQTKLPLPIVVISYIIFTIVGLLSLAWFMIRSTKRVPYFIWLSLLISGLYVAVLILQLYGDYVTTAQPVAINGRYLLPLLPLVGASMLYAMKVQFRRLPEPVMTSLTIFGLVALGVGGAGVITYILQSDPHWFWPGFGRQSHAVLQQILNVITIHWRF